ncbi:hypothetical protein IC582_010131 [Cucumis melo]
MSTLCSLGTLSREFHLECPSIGPIMLQTQECLTPALSAMAVIHGQCCASTIIAKCRGT